MSTQFTDVVNGYFTQAEAALRDPVIAGLSGAAVGAIVGGTVVGAVRSSTKKRRSSARKKRSSPRKTSKRPKKRNYKYARTARKRKDTSTRRIRMTKNGQPYVILKSGKARFISKRSARSSRKRKGGRY